MPKADTPISKAEAWARREMQNAETPADRDFMAMVTHRAVGLFIPEQTVDTKTTNAEVLRLAYLSGQMSEAQWQAHITAGDVPAPQAEGSGSAAPPMMDPLTERPRRRVVMLAKFEADDWETLQHQLNQQATEIAMHGRLSSCSVSGGYSTGHIIVTSEDGNITHDSWAAELNAWLDARKDQP